MNKEIMNMLKHYIDSGYQFCICNTSTGKWYVNVYKYRMTESGMHRILLELTLSDPDNIFCPSIETALNMAVEHLDSERYVEVRV